MRGADSLPLDPPLSQGRGAGGGGGRGELQLMQCDGSSLPSHTQCGRGDDGRGERYVTWLPWCPQPLLYVVLYNDETYTKRS